MSSPVGASNAGSTSAATSGTVRTPPDILTYRYGDEMVYVTRGETYEEAIDFAQEAFPALRKVDREQICLEVSVVTSVNVPNERRTVRIGKRAWPVVVAALKRFEIVGIHVAGSSPDPVPEPPPYRQDSRLSSEKNGQYVDGPNPSSKPPGSPLQTYPLMGRVSRLFVNKTS